MRSRFASTAVLGIGLLLCAGCGVPASGRAGSASTSAPQSAAPVPSSAPQPDAPVSSAPGGTSSGGEQPISAGGSGGGSAGAIAGSPGASEPSSGSPGGADGSPPDPSAVPPAAWKTLRDASLGFAISYPATLTFHEQPGPQADTLRSLRFLDSALANQPGGDFPQFSIDVFSNPGKLSLDQWLDANANDGARQAMTIDNQQGYQVTLPIEIAPNQFYYVISGERVYKLTPLGEHGQQMLQSFTLQP